MLPMLMTDATLYFAITEVARNLTSGPSE